MIRASNSYIPLERVERIVDQGNVLRVTHSVGGASVTTEIKDPDDMRLARALIGAPARDPLPKVAVTMDDALLAAALGDFCSLAKNGVTMHGVVRILADRMRAADAALGGLWNSSEPFEGAIRRVADKARSADRKRKGEQQA